MSNKFTKLLIYSCIGVECELLQLTNGNEMTEQEIEKLFGQWYDNRPSGTMPPGSYESFKAGWEAAKNDKGE